MPRFIPSFPALFLRLLPSIAVFFLALCALLAFQFFSTPVEPAPTLGAMPTATTPLPLSDPPLLSPQNSDDSDDLAFPADAAGFSAYYRRSETVNGTLSFSLNKDSVDQHIFAPILSSKSKIMTAPGTLLEVGDNYTVAPLP